MMYINTLCCVLLPHVIYYYPVLYITTPCCILLPCAVHYYTMHYNTLDKKFKKQFFICDDYVINLFVCVYEVRKGT